VIYRCITPGAPGVYGGISATPQQRAVSIIGNISYPPGCSFLYMCDACGGFKYQGSLGSFFTKTCCTYIYIYYKLFTVTVFLYIPIKTAKLP
jgi:hypothetical protein